MRVPGWAADAGADRARDARPDGVLDLLASPVRARVGIGSKLRDPLVRYAVTTFTYGSRMGAAQAARHMGSSE